MKLYYSPGACSQAPHIILHEIGLDHDAVRVDLRAKTLEDGSDYLAVNPKGAGPALQAVLGVADSQHGVGYPRGRDGTELDPARRHVEIGGLAPVEERSLDPDPSLRVLGAPVVADHPRPFRDLDLLAAEGQPAVEPGARIRG